MRTCKFFVFVDALYLQYSGFQMRWPKSQTVRGASTLLFFLFVPYSTMAGIFKFCQKIYPASFSSGKLCWALFMKQILRFELVSVGWAVQSCTFQNYIETKLMLKIISFALKFSCLCPVGCLSLALCWAKCVLDYTSHFVVI